jgi:hypothetical protein
LPPTPIENLPFEPVVTVVGGWSGAATVTTAPAIGDCGAASVLTWPEMVPAE